MSRFLNILLLIWLAGCTATHTVRKDDEGVTLALDLGGAREVLFASSLDGFTVHKARKGNDGAWLVRDLDDREFRYFYIVDGKSYVPECRFMEKDDFGLMNCIYQP